MGMETWSNFLILGSKLEFRVEELLCEGWPLLLFVDEAVVTKLFKLLLKFLVEAETAVGLFTG